MLAPPSDLDPNELQRILERAWNLRVDSSVYLAVGFGSHHWDVWSDGRRLFVTVHDLRLFGAAKDPARALEATFQAALQVRRQARLEFIAVVVPSRDGSAVVELAPGYVVSVQDWLDVQGLQDPDGRVAASVVACLHQATFNETNRLTALREDFAIPHRAALEPALGDVDKPWCTGPYGERARDVGEAIRGIPRVNEPSEHRLCC